VAVCLALGGCRDGRPAVPLPVEGVVYEANGQPVAGAEVTLENRRMTSTAGGRFHFAAPDTIRFAQLTVTSTGFATVRAFQRIGDGHRIGILLRRDR